MTAFTLVVIGLLTFVIPTIKFDPPTQDRQYWSVLDMVRRPETNPEAETLYPSSLLVVSIIPFEWIYVIYTVLFVSLGAILLFPFRKLLIGIGIAGLACLVLSFGGLFGLVRFIMAPSFRSSQGGDLKILWATFAAVLLALTISAWTDATT